MAKSIWVVQGVTRYGAALHFLHCLAEEWTRLGHVINGPERPDWVLSINGAGLIRNRHFVAAAHLGLLIDDPIHLLPLFAYPLTEARLLCIDKTFCTAIGALPGWEQAPLFCPHGGWLVEGPEEERTIDLLFCGTYDSPHRRLDQLKQLIATVELPPHWRSWMGGLMLGDELHSISSLLKAEDWEAISYDRDLAKTLQELDLFLRSKRRYLMLRECAEAGLVVDLCGDGWEGSPFSSMHRVRGPVPYRELPHLLRRAKIALNAMPNFSHGLHERILTAMGAGALVATVGNGYMRELFLEEREVVYIDEYKRLPDQLRALLADDARREEMARAGQQRVIDGHTWAHRAQLIHDLLFC